MEESPFSIPTPSDYIQLVSQHVAASDFDLEEWWSQTLRLAWSLPPQAITARIVTIAQKLQAYPRLLHGANCLVGPRYRIHCSTTSSEVKHFVIANQETHHSEIYSFTAEGLTASLSRKEIQLLLPSDEKWDRELRCSDDDDWRGCVAQILQEMLHDPQVENSTQSIVRKRLGRLGKAGILPPSIFIHFVDSNIPHYELLRESSTSGGFCAAHKITVNGVPICFRVLHSYADSDQDKTIYKTFCRELSVWQQLKHPNILPLIGATMEAFPGRYCFLVPWLENGSLVSYSKNHPDYNKFLAISQIVEGLSYLHGLEPPVGHKDIKGANVLVRSDLVCVITDFGLSSLLESQRSMTHGKGTHFWTAPEVQEGLALVPDQDSRPRDIYSLGSTIAEILIGAAPSTIWFTVMRKEPLTLPPLREKEWPQDEQHLWRLAKACLAFDPGRRPLISAIRRFLQDSSVRESTLSRNWYRSTAEAPFDMQVGPFDSTELMRIAQDPNYFETAPPRRGVFPKSFNKIFKFFRRRSAHDSLLPLSLESTAYPPTQTPEGSKPPSTLPSRRSSHDSAPPIGTSSVKYTFSPPIQTQGGSKPPSMYPSRRSSHDYAPSAGISSSKTIDFPPIKVPEGSKPPSIRRSSRDSAPPASTSSTKPIASPDVRPRGASAGAAMFKIRKNSKVNGLQHEGDGAHQRRATSQISLV